MNYSIPSEIENFLETIKKFVQKECLPIEDEIESTGEVPEKVIQGLRDLGLFGITIPEKYGGLGLGLLPLCLITKELSKAHWAIRVRVTTNNGIGARAIHFAGSEGQKKRFLPPLASGDVISSFCLTEPNAGSDASSIQTTAIRANNGWIINGVKHFITNAPIAGLFTVLALTDKVKRVKGGITMFVVERATKGLKIGKIQRHMGSMGHLQAEVIFEDCFVPDENVIGNVGDGFKLAMKVLDEGRLSVSSVAIGTSERLLEMARDYAKMRMQFGKPICEFQAIQWMLADSATELHSANLMMMDSASKYDSGKNITRESAMTKLFATETAGRIADRALQIYAGMGYMRESKIERMYRDIRLLRIGEGTSEIQRIIIARSLLK